MPFGYQREYNVADVPKKINIFTIFLLLLLDLVEEIPSGYKREYKVAELSNKNYSCLIMVELISKGITLMITIMVNEKDLREVTCMD